MPRRIQLHRTRDWRLPEGAINVARPTRWGNPFVVGSEVTVLAEGADGDARQLDLKVDTTLAVALFRADWESRLTPPLSTHPDDQAFWAEQRAAIEALRGHDLACWCPLDSQPCHADVLLQLANSPILGHA